MSYEIIAQDIIKSPEAERMREMVTKGFYDRSRIGLWLFEVIGREYDSMAELSAELRYEAFPQTCTWSIGIWEFICDLQKPADLPDDEGQALQIRRARLMAKHWDRPPVNPARTEAILSSITGCQVNITENVALNTFRVDVVGDSDMAKTGFIDFKDAVAVLRAIKQSHLSFEMTTLLTAEFSKVIRIGGVVWGGIMETRLPQWSPHVDNEQAIHFRAITSSIAQTELKPYAFTKPAIVKNDEIGMQGAKLRLKSGDVVDMAINLNTNASKYKGEG